MSKVLVTGGSGFIGSHVVLKLLAAGHTVRATVRDTRREPKLRAMLKAAGADPGARLTFVAANLESPDGWAEAAAGCEYAHHVASPFPPKLPRHEDELIRPAREGTLRVLRAARDAGVKRVVLTSSFAAVGYGHEPRKAPFDETTWTNLKSPHVMPYVKSKTLAERAAWDFLAKEGQGLELAVVNPVGVFGPVLGADYATSILIVKRMLAGDVPGVPRITFGVVDVRDVADLHLRAMTDPLARGERFLATAGDFMTLAAIARLLKDRLGNAAAKVKTLEMPDFVIRLVAVFDSSVRQIVPELGVARNATSEKAMRMLGWLPRSREEALLATAESLIQHKLV